MAYLTNYTFGKLCRTLDINVDVVLEVFMEYIYDDIEIFAIFNKMELKYLFNYKNILADEKGFSEKFYQEIPEKIDTKTYVFERGGKSKYHLTNECGLIKKDFLDFNIPPEIQEKGDLLIEIYRNWFRDNYFSERYTKGEITPSQIVYNYNNIFPQKHSLPILNENYKLVQITANSKDTESEDEFDFEKFSYQMSHYKKLYSNTFNGGVLKVISKHDYLLNKSDLEISKKLQELFSNEFPQNYGIENVKEKFRIAKNIKTELLKNLIKYFKWTYGLKDKDFNAVVLEKFGLECCQYCKNNNQ